MPEGKNSQKDGQTSQLLAEKAFPQLQVEAREQMALTQYLLQIDNTQLAFSVKQQKPTTLDAAVSATLEMESYLSQNRTTVGATGTELCSTEHQTGIEVASTSSESTDEAAFREDGENGDGTTTEQEC